MLGKALLVVCLLTAVTAATEQAQAANQTNGTLTNSSSTNESDTSNEWATSEEESTKVGNSTQADWSDHTMQLSGDTSNPQIIIPVVLSLVVCLIIVGIIIYCCKKHSHQHQESTDSQNEGNESAGDLSDATIEWKREKSKSRRSTRCKACGKKDGRIRTKCGHYFHTKCLKNEMKQKEECPRCKSEEFDPVKIYCSSCYGNYHKINYSSIEKMKKQLKICSECISQQQQR